MAPLLQFFILIPFFGFLCSLLVPRKKESVISGITIITVGVHAFCTMIFGIYWLYNGHPLLDIKHAVIFKSADVEIFIDLYFDKSTAVFAFIGAVLAFLVSIFSKYYLHREEGFKRFFNTMLLFYVGYNIIIFSGNFETLFVGWEFLGISSFLLIAFYRDRYLPVKNGLKVISFYRLSDICLMLAMWMSHHLWHENITFSKLNDLAFVHAHLEQHYSLGFFIALMILIAAAVKSAQLPFSSWLPRSMEGPTTSSAIFYGSLSVHIGVFLLLRTFPFWEGLFVVKAMIFVTGLATGIIATGIARVQSSVKTQIAYSSAAQIGIIFIEVALGLHTLALIHFAGNAFLRTYQLLVSPSVLSYLVHDQFYNFTPRNHTSRDSFLQKITNTFYILCIKEWNLDSLHHRFLWSPFKWMGNIFSSLTGRSTVMVLLIPVYLFGLYCVLSGETIPESFYGSLPYVFSSVALILVLTAFTGRDDARKSWILVFSSQLFLVLAVALNDHFGYDQILLYLSGIVISTITGYTCLAKIKSVDADIDLHKFHGYAYEYPTLALVFLLACLGLLAFPITPTFIGADLLFTHIHKDQTVLITFTALCFIFIELSVLRIYARIFLGQHKKAYHAIAYRSS
jgi:NADH-quinone oxidoreductase subunit L